MELLDLSGNVNIQEIPESLDDLANLETLKLWKCNIKNFSSKNSKFFWMDQNYRYFKGYSRKDKEYYEKIYASKASTYGRLDKKFVNWLFRLKTIMSEYNFNHNDIKKYEKKTEMKAIQFGRPTNSFLKYLEDRKQRKINQFL